MTKIIGYVYQADTHCIACTQARRFDLDPDHPHASPGVDENGVSLAAIDDERNLVHPMFSTDETPPRGEYCGVCFDEIAAPWLPDGYEVFEHDQNDAEPGSCWVDDAGDALPSGWYWWACQPACLPDGDPNGPHETQDAAIKNCASGIDW